MYCIAVQTVFYIRFPRCQKSTRILQNNNHNMHNNKGPLFMLNTKNLFSRNYRLTIKKSSNHSILTSEMRVGEIFIPLTHFQKNVLTDSVTIGDSVSEKLCV